MTQETVGVVVGTFGDERWEDLARERALPSAWRQTVSPDQVVHVHAATLAEARNRGAEQVAAEFLVFLDADDELDVEYVQAMRAGTGDIRQPSTLGVYPDGSCDERCVLIPERLLAEANYIVIGAAVRRSLFLDVGGFRDLPVAEDWDLWARCWLAGAQITACPDAIYRVHVTECSRNTMSATYLATYKQLRSEFQTAAREKGML